MTQARMTITDVNTLAERLKSARDALGLSQEQVALRAGVSQGTIGNIESGTRKRPRELLAIAKAVKVSPDWLLKGVGPRLTASSASDDLINGAFTDKQLSCAPVLQWGELGVSLNKSNKLIVSEQALQYLPSSKTSDKCKLITLKDESLAPRLRSGDMVAIDPENTTPRRDQVVLVASQVDGAVFLRRFRPLPDGLFEAYSEVLPTLHSGRDDLRILGVACGVRLQDI